MGNSQSNGKSGHKKDSSSATFQLDKYEDYRDSDEGVLDGYDDDEDASDMVASDRLGFSYRSNDSVMTPVSSVHGNLMRSNIQRDPMKYYVVCSILGKGSMGSVAKVKKKASVRGGSARADFVKKNHGVCYQQCQFCLPLLAIFKGKNNRDMYQQVSSSSTSNTKKISDLTSSNSRKKQQDSGPIHMSDASSVSSFVDSPGRSGGGGGGESSGSLSNGQQQQQHRTRRRGARGRQAGAMSPGIPRSRSGTPSRTNRKQLHTQRSTSSMITYGTKKEMYYALKSIHLDRCSSVELKEELKNEVEILKGLDHPNIVRAIETFDFRKRLFIVLELCSGGDLYARDPYTEEEAAKIVKCLLSAVSYLHSKGIVHRDLKFENVCFADKSESAEVRIIDFGLSQKFAANEHLHDAVGTVYTMAPELLGGDYDAKVDVWSVGVIAFSLLSSSLPFYGKDRLAVVKKIFKGKYRFSSRRWRYISSEAKDFIHTLLQRDPEIRPSAEDAMDIKWLNKDFSNTYSMKELEQLDMVQSTIQAFGGYRTLKKLALMVVAYKSTSEEIGFLRKIFNRFDRQHSGEISLTAFKETLSEHYNYSDDELQQMFHGIDIDGSGSVHYIEFLAATIEAHGAIDEERLAEAFDRIDSDDSGYITVADLKDFLGEDIPEAYLEKVIEEADIMHDKRISYDEFLELWDTEADNTLKRSRNDVHKRRKVASSTNSMVSSVSSIDDDSVTNASEQSPKIEPRTGTFYYSQRKAQSVRKGEIDVQSTEVSLG